MPDDLDRAAEHEQLQRQLSLAEALTRPAGPLAVGACLFCETTLAEGLRWCDADCRDLWERERKAKDRNRPVAEPE